MRITESEELIINIGDKTQCISKKDLIEQLEFIQNTRTAYQKPDKLKNAIEPNHYMKYKIIPLDFILANDIPFVEGNVIKYVCRWKDKNGIEDLKKAISYLEKLIKNEENGNK